MIEIVNKHEDNTNIAREEIRVLKKEHADQEQQW